MPMKWLAFLVFVWVASAILAEIMAEGQLAASAGGVDYEGDLRVLTGFAITGSEETWGVMNIISAPLKWAQALFNMLTFKSAQATFLTGPWVYVTWLVLGPIIAATVWGVVYTFIAIFQRALT